MSKVWSLLNMTQPVCRTVPPSMASMATAVLVFEGKKGIAGILTFTHAATSKVSTLVFFEALGINSHNERTDFLCVFTILGFELHQYSGARNEINMPGMVTGLTRGIKRLE